MSEKMNRRRPVSPAIRAAAIETLETRRLLSAAPKLIAIADGTQNFGNTQRSVAYYDVSEIGQSANPGSIFDATPLFTVWMGYENTLQNNYEEISALTVNPANGDTYVLSFDSGSPGAVDAAGDTEGDFDLYRFDIGKIYTDFITNNRPRGIMYQPAVSSDGFDAIASYGTNQPNVDSGLGIHPNRSNIDGDSSNDFIFIEGAIHKVGEIARVQQQGQIFFDEQDLQFVDAETLILIENKRVADSFDPQDDHTIRTIERVSKLSGQASVSGNTGGYNGGTVESWQSFAWTGDNALDMDNAASTGSLSEIDGARYVEQNGARGIWVSERDGGGDDFSFFALDFDNRVAQKQELQVGNGTFPTGFALDNDPVADPQGNDGNVDFFDVDEYGKLIIGESGFYDAPQHEPKIITREILDYNAGDTDSNGRTEIDPGGWTVTAPISPTLRDDANVVDGRFGVFDRGSDYVFYFDLDSGSEPSVRADVYVVDIHTGQVVYEELDAINQFLVPNNIRVFTLGDFAGSDDSIVNADGIVDARDIDALAARTLDPTVGGRYSAAIGNEQFDLDGDDVLTVGNPVGFFTVSGDRDYLVRRILGTEYGDANLDGVLDTADQIWLDFGLNFGFNTWEFGEFDGDWVVSLDDQTLLDFAIAFNPNPIRV